LSINREREPCDFERSEIRTRPVMSADMERAKARSLKVERLVTETTCSLAVEAERSRRRVATLATSRSDQNNGDMKAGISCAMLGLTRTHEGIDRAIFCWLIKQGVKLYRVLKDKRSCS